MISLAAGQGQETSRPQPLEDGHIVKAALLRRLHLCWPKIVDDRAHLATSEEALSAGVKSGNEIGQC